MNAKFKQIMDTLDKERDQSGIQMDSGKLYSQVSQRIRLFRSEFGDEYGIDTEVLIANEGFLAHARVKDRNGQILSSGHAMVRHNESGIAGSNPIESAETSAVGRALAFFGLAGGEFPSAEEMNVALTRKPQPQSFSTGIFSGAPTQTPPARNIPQMGASTPRYQPRVDRDIYTESDHVSDELARIQTLADLNAYWAEIQEYREHIGREDTDLFNQIRAAFGAVKAMFEHKGQ